MINKRLIAILFLAGCDLGPRVADPPDASGPPMPDTPPPSDGQAGFVEVLPPGTVLPNSADNAELLLQIRINDGLNDATQATNNNVVKRLTGKSNGQIVNLWNFGPAPIETNIAVLAPLYVFGRLDADSVFTPLAEHPRLIDTIPGDIRYSAMRRVVNVPVTELYAGEVISSVAALGEAVERGLVGEGVNDGTWVNMPVVLPETTLEVGGGDPIPPTKVIAKGYMVDVFELGVSFGRQPLRNGFLPIGQASGLQTGVPAGDGSLPTAIDSQLVFQFPLVTEAPTVFSYSPLATDVTVRLAPNVAPSQIDNDAQLFKRSATGAVTAVFPAAVASFTVNTTVNNLQLQFTEGMP